MFTSNLVSAQLQPADCHNVQCSSNDVQVISAYISAPNDMPIDCNSPNPFLNAELHLIVSSNTQRIGISLSGALNTTNGTTIINTYPIGHCFTGITLNNGANNNLVYNLGTILSAVQCGPGFDLSNLFISWGTGNTDFCMASPDPMCPGTPAKCRFVPGEIIPVTVKLEVDFSWVTGVCATGGNSLALNFTPSVITAQNLTYPLTFTWDFGDGSAPQTTTASSLADVANAGISHTYANANTYVVTLTGSDASPFFSKTSVHNITVTACCNLATPTASITQPTCATSTGSVQVNNPVSGVTYKLSNLDNTYTADNNGLFSAVATGTYSFTASTATCGADGNDVVINTQPATPAAPILSIVDNCGSSEITAKDGDGNIISSGLTWSNGATGNPITVTTTDAVTATLTVGSCTSVSSNSITPAPKTIPNAPILSIVDNCGSSEIIAKDGDGNIISSGLTWSNGATGNPITVTSADAVTATLTVGGCTSGSSNSVTPAPKTVPDAPILSVVDNCGNSVITAKDGDGNIINSGLTWSNGATGNPITVTTTDGVTATLTVVSCTSVPSNSVTPAPKTVPNAPTVTVVNNCGSSDLTASNYTGTLLWSNGSANVSIHVTDAATYFVTQTTSNGCTSLAGSGLSAPKAIPTASISVSSQSCTGGTASFTLTATTNGTVTWSKPAGADGSFSSTTTNPTTYTPGPLDRKNGVTITLTTYLGTCSNSATTNLTTAPCGPYYTYTQGYYSSTGSSCTPTGGLKPSGTSLIQYALDNMDGVLGNSIGQLYLGKTGASFTVNYADASKLLAIMPGGGTAAKLNKDYNLSTSANYPPLKNGKINNVLLSQTVTLALNINIQGDGLKTLVLQGGYLTTKKGIGCPITAGGTCSMSSLKITTNTTLLNLLKGKTVGDLLNMASNALGGTVIAGVSLTDINNAVDVINRSFDGGAFFLGYFNNAQSCSSSTKLSISDRSTIVSNVTKLSATAYPNPFTDKVRFSIVSPVSGKASLDIYNVMGQRVARIFEGYLFAGRGQAIEYNTPSVYKSTLIYILKVGDQQVNGKLIQVK